MMVPIFPDDWGHPNTPFWIVNVFAEQADRSGLKAQEFVQWKGHPQQQIFKKYQFLPLDCVRVMSKTNLQKVSIFAARIHVDGVFSVFFHSIGLLQSSFLSDETVVVDVFMDC